MNTGDVYLFPATFGQEQLWYLNRLDPDSTAYNIAFAFTLRGALDTRALAQALALLVARHDALRTGITMLEDGLKQVVTGTLQFELQTESLEALTAAEREAALSRQRSEFARWRFDLEAPSLFAARLLRLADAHHELLLCVHHIVVDHLSVLTLGRELSDLYASCRRGATPGAQERLQFGDFAVWQREQLTEAAIGERLVHWREALGGRRQALELSTDRPRSRQQSFAGAELAVEFSAELSGALRRYAQSRRQSLFMVLLGTLAVVLHRYSGQRDLIIGSPFANRPSEEVADVVGLFMNVLPIPLDVDPDAHFEQLLAQVRRQMTKAQALQDTPFERIVKAVREGSDPSVNPLVQVWYTFQDAPLALALDGLEVTSTPLHNGGAKLDLSLWFWDEGRNVRGLIEYNTQLFDAATVARLGSHLATVAAQIVADDRLPVGDYGLLDADERDAVAVQRERMRRRVRFDSLHGGFFRHAAADPNHIVLMTADTRISAGALAAKADAIAAALLARNVGSGSVVGVCLRRDVTLVAALLGILRAGAAYLPLDASLPPGRVDYMLRDSGAALVIADQAAEAVLGGLSIERLDPALQPAVSAPVNVPEPSGSAQAYLIYTSGSTGQPKGVCVSHAAAANFIAAMAERPGIGSTDVVLAMTTVSFDISVLELFVPLALGATVYLADRVESESGAALAELIESAAVSVMQATPSSWRMLRAAGWEGRAGLRALSGGEALAPELAQWLLPRVAELWNMYGPTETTVWSSCARIDAAAGDQCPIGTPVANTELYVVDERRRLLPDGVPGELAIGGAGLALGYHRREKLTHERFVVLPEVGERVYLTGDRALRRRDGQYLHLGRIDAQLKVRGHRIEPGEIEAVLAQADGVAAVAVRDWRPSDDDHRLVAWYSIRPGASVEPQALRAHARATLPPYMVPQHFLTVAAMPLTSSGKIDRARLEFPSNTHGAASESAGAEVAGDSDAPADAAMSAQETFVLGLCRELIGQVAIELDDNFFEVGGHSLLALTFAQRIERATGSRVALLTIANSTLRAIAAEIAPPGTDAQRPDPTLGKRLSRWLQSALAGGRKR
jgi:amino acid adenylation domain-containing protein